jgi:hypothetical protein
MNRYVIGPNAPGVRDWVLVVLLALALGAVVILGVMVLPFVVLWRLLPRPFST